MCRGFCCQGTLLYYDYHLLVDRTRVGHIDYKLLLDDTKILCRDQEVWSH
jgi:hypothetical protein